MKTLIIDKDGSLLDDTGFYSRNYTVSDAVAARIDEVQSEYLEVQSFLAQCYEEAGLRKQRQIEVPKFLQEENTRGRKTRKKS